MACFLVISNSGQWTKSRHPVIEKKKRTFMFMELQCNFPSYKILTQRRTWTSVVPRTPVSVVFDVVKVKFPCVQLTNCHALNIRGVLV
jgi:hypothetical protein